jgi:YHS domain-containing protein
LLQGHSLTVGQIAQMTALRQATVSQHLMTLKDQGLVACSQSGKEIYYTLSSGSIVGLATLTKSLTRVTPVEDAEPTVVDPICRMHLTPNSALHTTDYDGVRHYFCGKGCLKEFNISRRGSL